MQTTRPRSGLTWPAKCAGPAFQKARLQPGLLQIMSFKQVRQLKEAAVKAASLRQHKLSLCTSCYLDTAPVRQNFCETMDMDGLCNCLSEHLLFFFLKETWDL